MHANVGSLDRIIRIVLGIVLIALPFLGNLPLFDAGLARIVAIVVGIVLLATAAMRFCPLYRILGMRTCPR